MFTKRIHKVAAFWLIVMHAVAACSSGSARTMLQPVSDADSPGSDNTANSPQELYGAPSEMARTWAGARVRIPDGQGGVVVTDTGSLDSGAVVPDTSYPVVIWMHGCNGFWGGTSYRLDWLARNGFVAIAPQSTARSFYPQSCNLQTFESGLYRPTLLMRQYDAGYAIEQVRKYSWADKDNLILGGLSEGAAVAATYVNRENSAGFLKARIIESWSCHSGWSEYEGINAPASEAVLSLVADNDPWYTEPYHQGDCAEFMPTDNGSFSFVVDYEPQRNLHELWELPEIREIGLNFLLQQLLRE